MGLRARRSGLVLLLAALAVGCSAGPPPNPAPAPAGTANPAPAAWELGAQPLPRRPDGYGEVRPTPPALVDRRFPTRDVLPPPASGGYESTIAAVPPDVLARSSYKPVCPVTPAQLRYLTMSFWGFDGRPHTGEMLVNADVAPRVTAVFGQVFAAHFPLEEMRVATDAQVNGPPTGDTDDTSAFECRSITGKHNWSAHAYGHAVDVDPFQNPYHSADGLVWPELSGAYLDRAHRRPGMLDPGDPVVAAFTRAGFTWGATWDDPKDLQHFSSTGN